MEGRMGEGQSHEKEERSLHFCPGAPEFQVTPLSELHWSRPTRYR